MADKKAPAAADRNAADRNAADKKPPAADAAAKPAKPGRPNRKKLIAIGATAAVLLLGGGGAGAYLLLGKKDDGGSAKVEPKKMPVFVELDPFIVNLKDKESERFMQMKLVAEVRDAGSGEMLKTLMPSVRNEILLLLGSKEAADIATREGKEKLAGEVIAAANKVLEGTSAAGGVEHVNFTHIIVQ